MASSWWVFTSAERWRLWRAQGGSHNHPATCGICGEPMTIRPGEQEPWRRHTIDHVIPRSMDGPLRFGNVVLAHHPCNQRKANRPPKGCELVFLLMVNNRLGVEPLRW